MFNPTTCVGLGYGRRGSLFLAPRASARFARGLGSGAIRLAPRWSRRASLSSPRRLLNVQLIPFGVPSAGGP